MDVVYINFKWFAEEAKGSLFYDERLLGVHK